MPKERRQASAETPSAALLACARLAGAVGLLLLASYAVATILGGEHAALEGARGFFYYGVLAISAGLCAARALAVRDERAAWLLLAGALGTWIAAMVAYELVVVGAESPPYPSLADAFWLSFYVFAYAGLVVLVRARAARFRPALWLDGLLGMLALGALGAETVLGPVLAATGGSTSAVLTSLAYPVADLALFGFVMAFFALSAWRPGRAVGLLAVALAVQVATDSVYTYEVVTSGWQPFGLLDVGWLGAALLLAAAAWQVQERPRRANLDTAASFVLPALFTVVALGMLVYAGFADTTPLATAFATGALLVAVARLVLTQRESRRLAALARQDPLTGLLNHREFHLLVERELNRAQREHWPLSIALLDLDGFKALNDRQGHAEGDRVLVEVAAAIERVSRPSDTPCRIGGDEFALVLPDTEPGDAKSVADRIVSAVERPERGVGISYGIGSWPADGPTKDLVLLRADVALYAAKGNERVAVPAHGPRPATAPEDATERERERAQLMAYAEDVRTSYTRELRRAQELRESYLATVRALAAAVEAKDDYTGGHIQRVHDLGLLLAREVAPDEVDEPQMAYGFLLHDIGKLAVPDAVLTKPGRLTEDEWRLMRKHPEAGASILSGIPFLDRALGVVLHHHERWDGGGYPHGLAGEQIPLWARIFAVVDTVDAITSERPYSKARPLAVATAEILRGAGGQFDPVCAEAFAALDPATVEALLECRPPDATSPTAVLAGQVRPVVN